MSIYLGDIFSLWYLWSAAEIYQLLELSDFCNSLTVSPVHSRIHRPISLLEDQFYPMYTFKTVKYNINKNYHLINAAWIDFIQKEPEGQVVKWKLGLGPCPGSVCLSEGC